MSIFKQSHTDDIAVSVRAELFVVAALLRSLEICAEEQFSDCAEEADALINDAIFKVKKLIAEADDALRREVAHAA
jgi:hypothetical protein